MELIYMKKGFGQCQVERQIFAAGPGDLFLLPPRRMHALSCQSGQVLEYENLIFDMDFLGSGAADICAQQYLVPLSAGLLALPAKLSPGAPGYAGAQACVARVEKLCSVCSPGYELGVKGAMLEFLSEVFSAYPAVPTQAENPDTERLKAVLHLVETHYGTPLSVAAAAESCGYSQSHFMRWFKKNTGTAFHSYLNERRLAAAAEALRQTDDTVLAIAERSGFDNLSNFNRRFKARYLLSPSAYRMAR